MIKSIEKKIEKNLEELEGLKTELRKAIRNSYWVCPACNKSVQLKDLDLHQIYYSWEGYGGEEVRHSGFEVKCPFCKEVKEYKADDTFMLKNRKFFKRILIKFEDAEYVYSPEKIDYIDIDDIRCKIKYYV